MWALLFAIVIYLLISNLSQDVILTIDEEYTGKEAVISEVLEKLLKRKWRNKWRGSIRFARIGKSSPAHKLAWDVHRRKNRQQVRELGESEVLKCLK